MSDEYAQRYTTNQLQIITTGRIATQWLKLAGVVAIVLLLIASKVAEAVWKIDLSVAVTVLCTSVAWYSGKETGVSRRSDVVVSSLQSMPPDIARAIYERSSQRPPPRKQPRPPRLPNEPRRRDSIS